MEINIPIKSIEARIKNDALIVQSKDPLKALSSAILNGGLQDARTIIVQRILHMPEKDTEASVQALLENTVESLGLPKPAVGLTTGVDVRNVAVVTQKKQDLTVCALVTARTSYPATAGDNLPYYSEGTGTINIILLVDAELTEACMVDAVKTVIEAKAAALRELDIRSRFSNNVATGTITDGVVIAHTLRGELLKYAGTGTLLGELIGKAVKNAVVEAIRKQESITSNRSLIRRLDERRISFDAIFDAALSFYVSSERGNNSETSKLLRESLDEVLADLNVTSLVMAGLRLQEDWENYLIPGLPAKTNEKESTSLMAGKILGMAIASYIAGTEGIFEYTRFDKIMQTSLMRLGPLSEDVIRGIIAGVCARVRHKININ